MRQTRMGRHQTLLVRWSRTRQGEPTRGASTRSKPLSIGARCESEVAAKLAREMALVHESMRQCDTGDREVRRRQLRRRRLDALLPGERAYRATVMCAECASEVRGMH